MTLEVATYINQLNASYPEGGADRSTADDHLRLIKETVKATFPAVTGPVTVTHTELNLVAGATKTLASVSALTVKYSLSISAATADIARISQTVSVLWAKVTSMSALDTKYSLSISALTTSLNSVSVVLNTDLHSISAVLQASLSSVSAALQTNINAVSNTVSVMAVRINTLSVTVAVLQTDVGRISVTVSAIWTRINTLSASVSLLTTYLPTLATVQSATSTVLTFLSIPAWVKRITVSLAGVSTNGTSNVLLQIGDSGGLETTGYVSTSSTQGGTNAANAVQSTAGFIWNNAGAESVRTGSFVLTLVNASTNLWVCSLSGASVDTVFATTGGGYKALSATLDRVALTTVNGTDTFDAGSVNILYE